MNQAKLSETKIDRPKSTTQTGKVWDICDRMAESTKNDILAACVADGINVGTARVQYGRWLKAHGQK